MRTVICHYHIYKNAGTSFDAVLRASFGDRHLSFDGPFPFFTIDQEQLDRIIVRKGDAAAFSSHQIQLPVPQSRDYRVLGVVFLRHPILRLASVWRFKRRSADGTVTARLAAAHDFAAWLAASFADTREITQVSNAQTRLLSAPHRSRAPLRRVPGRVEYDLDQARANLAGAACVGRTETFAEDLARFAAITAAAGLSLVPPADLHLNATAIPTDPVGAQVARLIDDLPPALADALMAANAQDLALWHEAGGQSGCQVGPRGSASTVGREAAA